MEAERKRINRFMGIAMSCTIGTILGTLGVVMSGHFSWILLLISIVLSNVLGIVMTFLIPIKKISDSVSERIINRFFKALVGALIINAIYTPVITVAMVFSMSVFANTKIDAEIALKQEQLTKVEDTLAALENTGLQNGRIENYKKQVSELNQEIETIDSARPNPKETVLKSILLGLGVSTIVCMIVQPLWLKVAFRKYLNLR